jgi:hypothetical protein
MSSAIYVLLLSFLLDIVNRRFELGIDVLQQQAAIKRHFDVWDHPALFEHCAVRRLILCCGRFFAPQSVIPSDRRASRNFLVQRGRFLGCARNDGLGDGGDFSAALEMTGLVTGEISRLRSK